MEPRQLDSRTDKDIHHWSLLDEERFLEVLTEIGIEEVTGERIMGYGYRNTQSSFSDYHTGSMKFKEPEKINAILQQIGDIGMTQEFMNNFKVILVISLGQGNRTVVIYECDEQPDICDDCAPTHDDDTHSCDHGIDVCTHTYSVTSGALSDELVDDMMWFA